MLFSEDFKLKPSGEFHEIDMEMIVTTTPSNLPNILTHNQDLIYQLTLEGFNQHDTLEINGTIRGPRTTDLTIHAFHRVSNNWKITSVGALKKATEPDSFLFPDESKNLKFSNANLFNIFLFSAPTIKLEDDDNLPHPTNATITIDWGDGTDTQVEDFIGVVYTHVFGKGGDYTITLKIENIVSKIENVQLDVRLPKCPFFLMNFAIIYAN